MPRKPLSLTLCLISALLCSCWHSKQQLYTTVTNNSSLTLRSVEVEYPGGSYGIPELKPGASHRKWVAVTPPCTYKLQWVDERGKEYSSKSLDLGSQSCPQEVALTVDSSMNVSGSGASK